jgi:hypothetical protein
VRLWRQLRWWSPQAPVPPAADPVVDDEAGGERIAAHAGAVGGRLQAQAIAP